MPFSIYYSRVILPDMTAVSLATISVVFMLFFMESSYRSKKAALYLAGSIISFSLAVLCKPTTIFFGVPILYLLYLRYNIELLKRPVTYIFGLGVLAPFIMWRTWISQFPEGIPYAQWLFTSVNTANGLQSILLRPSFFRWVFYERIALLICGGYAHCLALLGALKRTTTYQLPLAFSISSIIYIFTFQGGNVQHDYYQIMLIPTLALLIGAGWSFLVGQAPVWKYQLINILVGILLVVAAWYFSWNQIKNYYVINAGIVKTAEVIKTLTLSTDLIATDTTGDTTLLYLSDRRGFPALSDEPDKLRERGIRYLVTYDMTNAAKLSRDYETLFINDTVAILRLSK
jgi:Dolichyl-phosphate-mannose-protein mannosyltransferase